MLSSDLVEFAKERITIEIGEREKVIGAEIQTILVQHVAKGLGRSGNVIAAVQRACAQETRNRVEMAWGIIHRGLTTLGQTYDTDIEKELRELIEAYFPEHMNGLEYYVRDTAQKIGMPDLIDKIPDEVGEARRTALRKASSEIKLYVMTLKKAPASVPYSPQFNIHNSTIGSVQTGSNSVANVELQISNEGSSEVLAALDVVSQALTKVGNLPTGNKDEIVELVQDSKSELVKVNPSGTKLRHYLGMIGGAIGTVADLKPAYDSLKAAAALLNITVP